MKQYRTDSSLYRRVLLELLALCLTLSAILVVQPSAHAVQDTSGVIQFRILKVTCDQQTFDLWGDDDIALGGTVASKFGVDMVPYRDLGSFDDDNDNGDSAPSSVIYEDWVFAEIPVDDLADYTRVQLSLVEVDLGGKDDFLANLTREEYEYVRIEMLAYFISLLEDFQDGLVTSADADVVFNPFGWLIGRALQQATSAATDYILGFLWDWLIGTLQDDVFRVQVVPAPVTEVMSLVAAGIDSPVATGTIVFVDHGARYEIDYSWTGLDASRMLPAESNTLSDYQPLYDFDAEMDQMLRLWEATLDHRIYLPAVSNTR